MFSQNSPYNHSYGLDLSARYYPVQEVMILTVTTAWTPPSLYLSEGVDNSTISVTFPLKAGFFYPENSVLPESHTITIVSSVSGNAFSSLTSYCNGFCSAGVTYSSPIVGEVTTATFSLTFNQTQSDRADTMDLVLFWYGFVPHNYGVAPTAIVSTTGSSGTYSTATVTSVDFDLQRVVFGNVISEDYSDISLIVSGLRFVNTSGMASGPVIQTVAGSYLAQYTYEVPRIYENVTFYESSLAFSPSTAGTASVITLGLDLAEGVLRSAYSLIMKLPGFTCSNVAISTGTVSWNSINEQMTVALSSNYLVSDARTTVDITGCPSLATVSPRLSWLQISATLFCTPMLITIQVMALVMPCKHLSGSSQRFRTY